MKREAVNIIKYVLDNILPPFIRDSKLYDALLKLYFKSKSKWVLNFRLRVKSMGLTEYIEHYQELPDIMGETDLNKACLDKILNNADKGSILDVGSGRGFLCKNLKRKYKNTVVSGIDIVISNELKNHQDINFFEGNISTLPFEDNSFDVVICTHVLEHILDFRKSLNELSRVCSKRLIIVVPMEREYRNGFNLHVQFFPYPHSFLNRIEWNTDNAICRNLGGDIYFQQDFYNPKSL